MNITAIRNPPPRTAPASCSPKPLFHAFIACAVFLLVGSVLHASGALHLAQTALGPDKVDPPNIAGVKTASDTIKGNIVAYVLLVLPAMVVFAGACVLVGLRLGQDLLGKVAGGLVILVALTPALLA